MTSDILRTFEDSAGKTDLLEEDIINDALVFFLVFLPCLLQDCGISVKRTLAQIKCLWKWFWPHSGVIWV